MVMLKKIVGVSKSSWRPGEVRIESGDAILDFVTMYNLILTNTWFKKMEDKLFKKKH